MSRHIRLSNLFVCRFDLTNRAASFILLAMMAEASSSVIVFFSSTLSSFFSFPLTKATFASSFSAKAKGRTMNETQKPIKAYLLKSFSSCLQLIESQLYYGLGIYCYLLPYSNEYSVWSSPSSLKHLTNVE